MLLPVPTHVPLHVKVDSELTLLSSICGDKETTVKFQSQRINACRVLNGKDITALKTYCDTWRSTIVPTLLKNTTHTTTPLLFGWSGPFGHDYLNVKQSCVLYESAMLSVALGISHLNAGYDCMLESNYKNAGKSFTGSINEFRRVETIMDMWLDFDAVALCPPILRRSIPQSMQLYATAWLQLSWTYKCSQLSETPDPMTCKLASGAMDCIERAQVALTGVHVGNWRRDIEMLKDEICLVLVYHMAKLKAHLAKTTSGNIALAISLMSSNLKKSKLDPKNALKVKSTDLLSSLVETNRRVFFEHDVPVVLSEHTPVALMVGIDSEPSVVTVPFDTH